MGLMDGKRGIVLGIANKNSIAWAVAQKLCEHGARLAVNYANERLEKNVRKLAEELPNTVVHPCDVSDDASIAAFYDAIVADGFETIDFIVHSVAYAQREDLSNPFSQTSREGFRVAHDISAFSLPAMVNGAGDRLVDGGSVVTMTYLGAERVVPNYNVMGVAKSALEASVRYLAAELGERQVRVNALSAGPVNTLSARGIANFKGLQNHFEARTPMRRNVELEEIANVTLFLVCGLSTGVSGERLHVDGGFHVMSM